MKELVVISGKGGTGKTSLAASFAYLAGQDAVLADCDVDAADMHLLMKPVLKESEDFYSGTLAIIDEKKCSACGTCIEVCRFGAITLQEDKYSVDPLSCEGCGYCSKVCPENAIRNENRKTGKSFLSGIKTGGWMAHAKLDIGADNSGKLVAKVKNQARDLATEKKIKTIIVDGSPGIGCPVVSSLSGADYVLLVTEPTVSGLHDLKRVHSLVKKFRLRCGCIINKFDLNPSISEDIVNFLKEESMDYIAALPYDEDFSRAIAFGQTMVEQNESQVSIMIMDAWNRIYKQLIMED